MIPTTPLSLLLSSPLSLLLSLSPILLVLLLLPPAMASTYPIEKQFHTNQFSTNDFSSWTITANSIPQKLFYSCNGKQLFGGYTIFTGDAVNPTKISKTWSGLIPHYSVRVQLALYKIDSWPTSTTFFLQVDSVTVRTVTFDSSNPGTSDLCGRSSPITDPINTSYNDNIVTIDVTVPHSAAALQLTMVSTLVGTSGSWGIRQFNLTMQACDQSCLACTNDTACLSCDAGNGMTLSGPFCVCSAGLRQKTVPCGSYPCATCTMSCTAGHYYSTTTLQCEPCHPACSVCTTPSNSISSCTSCSSGYVGTPTSGVICSSCSSGCKTCSSTSPTACFSCLYQYFYYSANNSCLSTCPAGYYSEEVTARCFLCLWPCATCLAGIVSAYFCASCASGYYLWEYACLVSCPNGMYGYNGNCLSVCPQATLADTGTGTCLPCPANCLYCLTTTTCTICQSSSFKLASVCYTTCPVAYYGDTSSGFCLSCDPSCSGCFGPSLDQCLSCSAGVLVQSTCYATCPVNSYSSLCLPCDALCLSCSGPSSSQCLSCAAPAFYHINLTTCLSECPQGDLSSNTNMSCLSCPTGSAAYYDQCTVCDQSCRTCTSPSFLSCASCPGGSELRGSTCAVTASRVIYNPSQASPSSQPALTVLLVLFVTLALLLQLLFQYKTNLLVTVELLQMLSYTYYLSIQLTENSQRSALLLYLTNISSLVVFPSSTTSSALPSKFILMGKTGYFLVDAAAVHIILAAAAVFYLAAKLIAKKGAWANRLYHKVNPYLLTYLLRLVALEWTLALGLYLYCFEVTSAIGAASLALLMLDAGLIVAASCWRIRTKEDGSQLAIVYNNEIGLKEETQEGAMQRTQEGVMERIRKNQLLPSSLSLLAKFPLPLTLLLFISNPATQSICLLCFYLFYSFLCLLLPYRRRIYKTTVMACCFFLVTNAVFAILVQRGAGSGCLDVLWVCAVAMGLLGVCLQGVVNYEWFLLGARFGWRKVKEVCNDDAGKFEKKEVNEQSLANLTQPQQLRKSTQVAAPSTKGKMRSMQPSSYLQLTHSKLTSEQDVQLDLNL